MINKLKFSCLCIGFSIFCLFIFFFAADASQASALQELSKERLEIVQQFVEEQVDSSEAIGGIYAIIHKDKVEDYSSFGVINQKEQLKPTQQSVYSIASLTKLFTAAAVLKLQDQGLISVDDPVQKYIPWFQFADGSYSKQLTIRHLLTHTAGGVDSYQTDQLLFENNSRNSLEDYIKNFRKAEMPSPPGTVSSYCNGCYDLLGLIIEKASGMSYYDFMEQHIFKALDMNRTGFGEELVSRQDLTIAKEYSWLFGFRTSYTRTFQAFGKSQDPDGGMYSTIEDVSRFISSALGYKSPSLLAIPTLEASLSDSDKSDIYQENYTLGGYEAINLHSTKAYYKDGDGIGSATALLLIPEIDTGILLFIGEFRPEIQKPLVEGIAAILLGYSPDPMSPSSSTLGKTIGIIANIGIAIGLLLFILLGWRIRTLKKRKTNPYINSTLALVNALLAAPIWFIFITLRPTGIGLNGFPYDLALAIIMLASSLSAWAIFHLLQVLKRRKANLSA